MSCSQLSLDAPLQGRPVTVGPGEVLWEGTDLLRVGAILVEAPIFPWPQPQVVEDLRFDPVEGEARISPEREARSLALSALWVASQTRPVWNPPEAGHLAASLAVALDRLGAAGLPVHPWSLEPAPEAGILEGLVIDCAGPERWHQPSRPGPGEPAIVFDPIPSGIIDLLVVGGRTVGATADRTQEAPPEAGDLALRAAGALGLAIAQVSMVGDPRSLKILRVEAGPDLAAWNTRLDGRLAPLLIERLVAAADGA